MNDKPILIKKDFFTDDRGLFQKPFNYKEYLKKYNIDFIPRECFFSISRKNIIRGMHFQKNESACTKLVFLTSGRCLDVVVNVDINSRNYGEVFFYEMKPGNIFLLIPKNFAHGFLSLEDNTTMIYLQDEEYNNTNDTGILWNSIDFDWPIENPILSERDRNFKKISDCI